MDSTSATCAVARRNHTNEHRSDDLKGQCREVLEIKERGELVVACGILLKMCYDRVWLSRTTAFNCKLKYCRENDEAHVDVWEPFSIRGNLHAGDGVHLS